MKKILYLLTFILLTFQLSALNNNLSEQDLETLDKGEILIKNLSYVKNISLENDSCQLSEKFIKNIKGMNPKYIAEVIQLKKYSENSDLPERLYKVLQDVPNYAGIPYYSEHNDKWYNLYDSAIINSQDFLDDTEVVYADLFMQPFGLVKEKINIIKSEQIVYYNAKNQNKLRYKDKFDCIWPEKMDISILLFRDGDNWVLYGIGAVNAPKVPFFTERIQTSFMNRINTFCTFIFKQF